MNSRSLYKLLLLAVAAIPLNHIKADPIPESALVVNEIMPANIDVCMDPSMNYGSWIELYNTSAQDIDIKGCYLSNDPSDKKQCPLGNRSRIVKAGGFLTLWFGHLDDYCLDQIEFSLSYEDGAVYLYDPDGKEICSMDYLTIPARISYARTTDGGANWSKTGYPTPGATNTTSKFASAQLQAPSVSMESKLFTGQISFSVSVPDSPWNASTETGTTASRIFALSAGSFDSNYISTVDLIMSHNENGQAVTDGVVAKIDVDASGVYSVGDTDGYNRAANQRTTLSTTVNGTFYAPFGYSMVEVNVPSSTHNITIMASNRESSNPGSYVEIFEDAGAYTDLRNKVNGFYTFKVSCGGTDKWYGFWVGPRG